MLGEMCGILIHLFDLLIVVLFLIINFNTATGVPAVGIFPLTCTSMRISRIDVNDATLTELFGSSQYSVEVSTTDGLNDSLELLNSLLPTARCTGSLDNNNNNEPFDQVNPTQPVNQVNPTEPIDQVNPSEPVDQVNPTEPIDQVNPTEPIDQVNPTEPVDQVNPTGLIDQMNSTEPVDQVNPIEPVDQVNFTEPFDQVNPIELIDFNDILLVAPVNLTAQIVSS